MHDGVPWPNPQQGYFNSKEGVWPRNVPQLLLFDCGVGRVHSDPVRPRETTNEQVYGADSKLNSKKYTKI